MTYTYAIADIHGRFDLLTLALKAIVANEVKTGIDTSAIITLGDYVDRGPQSSHVVDHLMTLQKLAHLPLICLKGNHEAMMVDGLRKPVDVMLWLDNGGAPTLFSYGHEEGPYRPDVVPDSHVTWLDELPLIHVDDHRVYVHAGVDPTIPLDEQKTAMCMWHLYRKNDDFGHGDYHVVHGHHQHEDGPVLYGNRTNLDVGAFYSDRLVVGVFDDEIPGGPVDVLEVKV